MIILNHEFCTLDLTPVAPDYSIFFLLLLLFPLFVPSNRATTGGNLTVLVQALFKGRGWGVGQCKCSFKTGVTDSEGKR